MNWGRLEKLNLYSLFCRRQRGDMIETYKILNRYYNMDPSTFFTLNISSLTRGHLFKLFKKRSRLLIRHNFFSNRVVNLWKLELTTWLSCFSINFQAAIWWLLESIKIWAHTKASGLAWQLYCFGIPRPLNNNNNNKNGCKGDLKWLLDCFNRWCKIIGSKTRFCVSFCSN